MVGITQWGRHFGTARQITQLITSEGPKQEREIKNKKKSRRWVFFSFLKYRRPGQMNV